MRIAIYARTAARDGNPSPSITRQLERLRAHVAAQGWEVAEENVFVDDGQSGYILERPGLEQLRVRVRAGEIDIVWATDMNRLTRNYADVQTLQEESKSAGCQVRFLDDPAWEDSWLRKWREAQHHNGERLANGNPASQ
jgi:site-specific DNA recombinase